MPEATGRGAPAGGERASRIRDLLPLLPLLGPYRKALAWAILAMVLDAALTVLRPWPLKVVIDLVLSHRHSRVPLVGGWLAVVRPAPMTVVYGACAATLLIALTTGWLTYAYTRGLGDIGQRFVFTLRRNLFAHGSLSRTAN